MKIFVDFDMDGPLQKSLQLVLRAEGVSLLEDDSECLVIVDSVQKVLDYLQKYEQVKVLQSAWGSHHRMDHLADQYPGRFATAQIEEGSLLGILQKIEQLKGG